MRGFLFQHSSWLSLAAPTFFPFFLLIFFGTKAEIEAPTKTTFCRAFSACRQKAQFELSQCSGGILGALAAKQGMLGEGRREGGQKCIQEMNKTVGNSIRGLYERVERRALKCAEQHSANPKRALGQHEILACKALHLDFLTNFSSPFALLSLRAPQFDDPSGGGPQECVQLYDAQLARCEALNKCCPELESCLESIEEEIEMRDKEMRVLKLVDKCMNEIPVKSNEVVFVKGEAGGNGQKGEGTESAENLDSSPPIPIPIPTILSTNLPPISTISPSTLLPPPDPTMRQVLDLLFPGLAINRQKEGKKVEKTANEKEEGREESGHKVDYLLDSAETRRRNLGNLVDLVMAKNELKNGGGKGMERIVEGEQKKKEKEDEKVENSSFVIGGSNSVEEGENEEEKEGNGAAESSDEASQTEKGVPIPTSTAQSPNSTLAIGPTNSTKSSFLEFSRQERAMAMTVGRIFCDHYFECISVRAKLGKDCPGQGAIPPEGGQPMKPNWFSIEQLGKCLEARPLKLLANSFEHSNFCSISEEFSKSCQLMRECCPSIV